MSPRRLRPAHGVALLFLANGLSHPSLWPRLPEIRDAVGASDATLGLALLGVGIGGVAGSALAPRVTRLVGVERAATVTAVILAVSAIGTGLVPNVALLFAVFVAMGLTDGVADISQNHLMFEVQRTGHRSLASRMHAVWSAGALLGTATGTLAATVGVGVAAQTAGLAVVATGLSVAAVRPIRGIGAPTADLPATGAVPPDPAASAAPHVHPARERPAGTPDAGRRGAPGTRRTRAWALVAVAGVVVAVVESVANEWSALTLQDGLGASVTVAGAGPTTFAGAMLVGRLVGDRAIDRLGARRVAELGSVAVAVGAGGGLLLGVVLSAPLVLVVGLAVAGVGAATLFPLMYAAGDQLDATGRGVAIASMAARGGMLAVPVTVGLVSDLAGPAVAFGLLPVAGVVAALALPAALGRSPR